MRVLTDLAAGGVSFWDAHPGNLGKFGDLVKIVDWADVTFEQPSGDPAQTWRLMSRGVATLTQHVAGPHILNRCLQTNAEWLPITTRLESQMHIWIQAHQGDPKSGLPRLAEMILGCLEEANCSRFANPHQPILNQPL